MIDNIYNPHTRVLRREAEYMVYAVPTVVGFVVVSVYLHNIKPEHDMTEFQAVVDGWIHSRTIYGKAYRQRGCTMLVRQWAEELKRAGK